MTKAIGRLLLGLMLASGAPLPAMAADGADAKTTPATSRIGIMPVRGMTMGEVEHHFGPPEKRYPAVGNPPISRWKYDGFIVYFEGRHVIHALATADD